MAASTKYIVSFASAARPSGHHPQAQRNPFHLHPIGTVAHCLHDLHTLDVSCPLNALDEFEKGWQLREFCTPLILAVKSQSHHLEEIDQSFSKLIPRAYRFDLQEDQPSTPTTANNDVCSRAQDILARMPRVPQRLFTIPLNNSRINANGKRGTMFDSIKTGWWKNVYILPEARDRFRVESPDNPMTLLDYIYDLRDHGWDNMFVTSYIDTNNLVFLLKIAALDHVPDESFARLFLQYVNLLSELVDMYEFLLSIAHSNNEEALRDPAPSVQALRAALFPEASSEHEMSLYILKSFLWSAWQRSVMLYFYYVIGVQLRQGSSPEWSCMLAIRGTQRLEAMQAPTYRGDDVPYLCNCAFELLRTSRSSLALDFRGLIDRFDSHFAERKGRCIKNAEISCSGDILDSCQRFIGAETKAQSCHAAHCDGHCPRVAWEDVSYRECPNPRAVIANADLTTERLMYSQSSSRTMAISHVWSHGQGGRPEDGVNLCLHQRYCALAKKLGCESYWIDSTCIPEEEGLRKEAIQSINRIFAESKVTLISDQDLQSVPIKNASVSDLEKLLSILLVCDWGVRGWTMLEAIKGNTSIRILCKDDETIALKDLLQRVHQSGAVDIAVLLGCVQHLLPSSQATVETDCEEIGHLLSRRHVSRKGDDVIVWSLLSTPGVTDKGHEFWKMHRNVKTGFLVSSAPRVEHVLGFSWAPSTPYIRPQVRSVALGNGFHQKYSVYYPSYDGRGSVVAQRTQDGLIGEWLCKELDSDDIELLCDICQESKTPALWLDQNRENFVYSESPDTEVDPDIDLYPRPDVAYSCALLRKFTEEPGTNIRLIRPLATDRSSVYDGGDRRGEDFAALVAICTSSAAEGESNAPGYRTKWHWQGVYEWEDDSVEDWTVEEMLIM